LQYDGVSWRLIPVGNRTYTRAVIRGDDGTLYVGAQGEIGYLAADSSGVLRYVSLVEKIDPAVRDFGSVFQSVQTSEGLYFRSSGVLFRWDGEEMRHWVADEGTEFGRIYAVRGTLYVVQWRAGLKRMVQDTLEMLPGGAQYAKTDIDAMLPYGEDQILVASYKEGLMRFDGQALKPFDAEANEVLIEREVYAGLLLPDGTYAFGTLRGGVVLMDASGRVQRVLDERLGLSGQDVKNLFLDRQGGLWLAMETGLARIDLFSPITVWDKRTGLEGAVYIAARHEGTLYAGTATGLKRLAPRTSVQAPAAYQFTPVADLLGEVFALQSTPHGLLVGTTTGIYVVEGNRSQLVDKVDDVYMLEASPRDDARVYAVFRSGLRELRYRQGQWHLSENVAALAGTELHHVHEDETGALWIGSYYDGLWRIDPTAALQADTPVRHLDPEQGYPQKIYQITSFRGETRIASGEAFLEPVVAADGTVTLVPDTTFQAYTTSPIMKIREASDGSIWLHQASAPLIRLQPDPDSTWAVSRPMARIATWVAYVVHLDTDGTYWQAGANGIVRLAQGPRIMPEVPFSASVRNVRTVGADSVIFGGGSLSATASAEHPRLAHTANALRFEYVAPSYTLPEKTTYQVRLDGFDEPWSDWTDETRKDYTNLPPGDYLFRVRARDYQGRISEEAAYAFVLLSPWYRSGWAYVVYLLLALGLLYAGVKGIVHWRSAKLEAQNRALEQTVAARTLQISEQNERLESQNALLKEQKQHIEAQAQKLKELDEVKNRFFANISHEFRTPLTLMMGPLENILGTTADDEVRMQRAALETSLRNARRLLHLINQLLDLAKLDAGRMALHADQGDFVQFLRILAAGFSSLAEQRGITLAFVSEPDYLDARFDTEKLEIAFYNLFSNALKFTPAGGEVVITLSHEDETTAVVSVRDTGIGIPADELPYVFDRFHQVNNALARSHEGTGIGLALVQNLISLHGGSVEVESIEGEGTTFHVRLPIVQDASTPADERKPTVLAEDRPTSHAAPYLPATSTSQPTREGAASAVVYVVDDNAEMRAYIADCLGEQYHMVAAANGQEALRMMRTTAPDLVITDLMMPHMDGYALIKALRRDEAHSRVPILMLTARATDDATIDALEAGADEYLAKPFNARELRARVQNMLALRQQARTLQALNEALTHTNELLWQESEAKTQLLGMAAHDLRNPLAGIIGFANVLQEDFDLPAEPQEFIGFIRSNAEQMHGLLEDLLNSVSIESGRITLNKKRLDLAQLAQWVVHSLRPQAEHKQQHLHYKAPKEPCMVEGDELRLREAITNLVTNAIKYSEAGKTIDVEVVKAEGTCKIAVQDEGPGLSQDDQALLFQPFQRLSPRPTNNEPSTGLGLYIVHQLMTLHDGSVTAESERGVGSTFTLVLPTTDSPPAPSAPDKNAAPARIKPRHELGKREA
jgi:signal transduction histidine kinase